MRNDFDAASEPSTGPVSAAGILAPLAFDADEYLSHTADLDLDEAQARELLAALWTIMVGFVDMGFGLSPITQVIEAAAGEVSDSSRTGRVLGSEN